MNENADVPVPQDVVDLYRRIGMLGQDYRIERNLDHLNEALDSLERNKKFQVFDVISFTDEKKDLVSWMIEGFYWRREWRKSIDGQEGDYWTYEQLFKRFDHVTFDVIGCKPLDQSEFAECLQEIKKQGFRNSFVLEKK